MMTVPLCLPDSALTGSVETPLDFDRIETGDDHAIGRQPLEPLLDGLLFLLGQGNATRSTTTVRALGIGDSQEAMAQRKKSARYRLVMAGAS